MGAEPGREWAIVPDYALDIPLRWASLFIMAGCCFPHTMPAATSSVNRDPPSGYTVIFIPFTGGQPSGPPDILTRFLDGEGNARGRSVDVAIDGAGALLVGDRIWRVSG